MGESFANVAHFYKLFSLRVPVSSCTPLEIADEVSMGGRVSISVATRFQPAMTSDKRKRNPNGNLMTRRYDPLISLAYTVQYRLRKCSR